MKTRRKTMKALLIINPNAGNGDAAKNSHAIINRFNEYGIKTEVMLTTARGDASEYVRNYGAGRELVICAGGDGTLNETINGIMSFPENERPGIGYIPFGTTNDFARSLRIPNNYADAIENIVNGKATPYDIGSYDGRYFVYVATFGAFSETSYSTPQDLKRIFGHTAYLFESVKALPSIKPHHMRFEFDTGEILEGDYAFGAISNTRSYGGVVNLGKLGVDVSDGLFEMTLIKLPKTLYQTGKVAYSLGSGEYDSSLITFGRFSSCKVITDSEELHWSIDGEKGEAMREVEIINHRRAISIVTKVQEALAENNF